MVVFDEAATQVVKIIDIDEPRSVIADHVELVVPVLARPSTPSRSHSSGSSQKVRPRRSGNGRTINDLLESIVSQADRAGTLAFRGGKGLHPELLAVLSDQCPKRLVRKVSETDKGLPVGPKVRPQIVELVGEGGIADAHVTRSPSRTLRDTGLRRHGVGTQPGSRRIRNSSGRHLTDMLSRLPPPLASLLARRRYGPRD